MAEAQAFQGAANDYENHQKQASPIVAGRPAEAPKITA
jgi:hypothetical protein